MARRLKGVATKKVDRGEYAGRISLYVDAIGPNGKWNGNMALVRNALGEPFSWRKSQMVFVNSMSDLFHENLCLADIRSVCQTMANANWHTYQVLTKRAERLQELLAGPLREFAELPHIWWGVSVENRKHGLPRIDFLRQTPAIVRFLSLEPLLEDLGEVDFSGIHWAIVGGESGQRCRPMDVAWARSLRDQCVSQRVPFFFKQFGTRNKKAAGRILDGRTWDEMPAIQRASVPDQAEIRRRMTALSLA
jgi:protein gp37